jgi:hypothetical protein
MKRVAKVVLAVGLVVAMLAVTLGSVAAAGPVRAGNGTSPASMGVGTAEAQGQYGPPSWGRGATLGAVAGLLGVSEETIQTERHAGKSLVEIAAGQNVSKDQVVQAILSSKKAALDAMVEDGKLTQAQADLMYQNMTQQVSNSVERTATGPTGNGTGAGCGAGLGRGGNGGGPGMMRGLASAQ